MSLWNVRLRVAVGRTARRVSVAVSRAARSLPAVRVSVRATGTDPSFAETGPVSRNPTFRTPSGGIVGTGVRTGPPPGRVASMARSATGSAVLFRTTTAASASAGSSTTRSGAVTSPGWNCAAAFGSDRWKVTAPRPGANRKWFVPLWSRTGTRTYPVR